MTPGVLHHHTVGDAERWLYVLHGIYGAGRNWATFARGLVERRPDWGAVLVDLRLHGHSLDFEPPHTLAACAHDLIELTNATHRPAAAILGHSFGGKVALMEIAALSPRQVWVIDSTPSKRTPGGNAHGVLEILGHHPGPFASRAEAIERLEAEGLASHVAAWMGTNLIHEAGIYRWRFDLDGVAALLDDFFRRDLWDVVEAPPPGTEIHFVRASESDVLTEAELSRVKAIRGRPVFGHELHGGHWLHVDNPEGLLELVVTHLP